MVVVLDFTHNLVDEEGLHSVVELVLPEVASNISHGVVRPVSEFDAVKEAIVLSNPQAVLKGIKINSGVKRIS
jgi:hypothetical protein